MQKKYLLITGLVLYILSTSATFAFFALNQSGDAGGSSLTKEEQQAAEEEETALSSLLTIDPGEAEDQPCPLNGKLYTQTEKNAWIQRRPMAVMIENSVDARPQSGLTNADVVYEAIAEGGITRFMGLFYCGAQRNDVTLAPVRSARTYFIDWASSYNKPIYVHVGGANIPGPANALGQLSDYGWTMRNDFNQFSIGYPTFVRNKNRLGRHVATEHTMQTTTEKLWAIADKRGWTNMTPEVKLRRKVIPATDWLEEFEPWSFMPIGEETAVGSVTDIKYEFWSGYDQFTARWKYDADKKVFLRNTGNESHQDLNNNQQVFAKNVVVMKTRVKGPIDELKHLLYKTTGSGDALIFTNGEVYKTKWKKLKRESELMFYDKAGKPFKFNRGLTWVSTIDNSNEVEY